MAPSASAEASAQPTTNNHDQDVVDRIDNDGFEHDRSSPQDALLPSPSRSITSSPPPYPGRPSSALSFLPAPSTSKLQPHLTYLDGLALVLSLQIGSGIFSTPSQVSAHVPSPGAGVLVWLVSGLLVWTGAASFGELGVRFPQNGGVQEYLRAAWGEFPAFLVCWAWVGFAKPAAEAVICTVFADYVGKTAAGIGGGAGGGGGEEGEMSWLAEKGVALLGLTAITVVNCLGARTGPLAANGFLALKVFALVSIILAGLVLFVQGKAPAVEREGFSWFGEQKEDEGRDLWTWIGMVVTAMYGSLFCYGGWETIGFVAGEMKDPVRDLPRVINTSMIVAVAGFTLFNVSLYLVVPFDVMRAKYTVAMEFGSAVYGPVGGIAYSLIVSISALGALNAGVFSAARLCAAGSKRRYFPAIFSNMHFEQDSHESDYYLRKLSAFPTAITSTVIKFASLTSDLRIVKEVPIYAILLNHFLVTCYLLTGTFNSLITFVGLCEYIFLFLSVAGIYRIRALESSSQRSDTQLHKTNSLNPAIFCLASGLIILRGLLRDPLQALLILLIFIVGWIFFRFKLAL